MGNVSGSYRIGGLAGYSNGSISSCYSTSNVSAYSSMGYVGGLVGCNSGSTSSISNCYSRGAVSGSSNAQYIGGLVGYKGGGSISRSFWDKQTSGRPFGTDGTGLSTLQMKQQASFTGWDFSTIWVICEGTNYPRLLWQIPAADWVCPDGVNTEDLGYLVQRWLESDCDTSNNCGGTDIDVSHTVDFVDFALFASYWLND